jgi:hypothetical protein
VIDKSATVANDAETKVVGYLAEVLHVELTSERFVDLIAGVVIEAEDEDVIDRKSPRCSPTGSPTQLAASLTRSGQLHLAQLFTLVTQKLPWNQTRESRQ